jgi:PAS domain S-box-containing protein
MQLNQQRAREVEPGWLMRLWMRLEQTFARGAWPISSHLVVFAVALLTPVLLFTALLVYHLMSSEHRSHERQLLSISRSIAADVDREINGMVSTMKALSNSPSLRDGNLEAFYQQAKLTLAPTQRTAALFDLTGRQLLNTGAPWGAQLPQTPNSSLARELTQNRLPVVSDLFTSTLTQDFLVSVGVPVMQNNEVVYVLVMSLEPDQLLAILRQSQLPNRWFATISDRNGRIIARTFMHKDFVGKSISDDSQNTRNRREGTFRSVDLEGRPSLQAFHWSELTGWRFTTWAPIAVVEAPLREVRRWLFGLGLASVALGALLAMYFGARLSTPITAAAQAGRMLGQGKVLKPLSSSLSEANEVVDALRATSVEIRQRTRELRNSDTRLRMAQNLAGLATFEWNLKTGQFVCSENFRSLFLLPETSSVTPSALAALVHPDDQEQLASAMRRVRVSGGTYDIEFRVLGPNQELRWIAGTGEALPDHEDTPTRIIGANYDVTAFKMAAESNAQLAAIIQSSQDAVMSMTPSGLIRTWNPGAEKLFGFRADEIIGQSVKTLFPEKPEEEFHATYDGVLHGENVRRDVVSRRKDGTHIHVNVNVSPMYDAQGNLSGLSSIIRDISDQKENEEHLRLVMRELSHRSKNLLAVIQAMARQTARSSTDVEEFEKNYSQRLQALSASHDLLVNQNWHGAPLADLLRSILVPFADEGADRIDLNGPNLYVTPIAAQNLALSIHELATNASKYGALSVPQGRVKIEWSLVRNGHADEQVKIDWTETGGPEVNEPRRQGFGHIVIKKMVAQALDADVDLTFAPEGVSWTLHMPTSFIIK